MKTKLLLITICAIFIASCGGNSLVKKRITQKIEADAMGMIKDFEIESIEKVNDTTYKGVHSFLNPMFDKEIRLTRNYFFTTDLDSITGKEGLKSEMKSEGEWIERDY